MSSPPAPTAEKRQLSADEEKNDEVSKRVRLDSEADSSQPAPRCELCSRQSELNEFWLSKREELEGPSAWQFRNVHREMEERQQPLRPIRRSHLREAQVVYVHEECAGNVRLSFHSLKGPRSEWEQLSRIKNWKCSFGTGCIYKGERGVPCDAAKHHRGRGRSTVAHSTCLLNEACILKDVDASTGNNQESEQQERKQQVKHGQHLDQQGRVQDAKIAGSGKEEKIEEVLRMEMDDDTESEDEDMQQISAAGQAAPSAVQLEGFIEEEGGEEEEDVAGSALINTAAGVQQVEQMINTLSDILEQAQSETETFSDVLQVLKDSKNVLRRTRSKYTFLGLSNIGKSTLIDLLLFMTSIADDEYKRNNDFAATVSQDWVQQQLEAVKDYRGGDVEAEDDDEEVEEKHGAGNNEQGRRSRSRLQRQPLGELRVEYPTTESLPAARIAQYKMDFHNQVVIGLERHKYSVNTPYKPSYLLPIGNPVDSTTSCLVHLRHGRRYQLRVKFATKEMAQDSAFELINDYITNKALLDDDEKDEKVVPYSLDESDLTGQDELFRMRTKYKEQFNNLTNMEIDSAEDLQRLDEEGALPRAAADVELHPDVMSVVGTTVVYAQY